MRLRYEDELDEALAWSGLFCRPTGFFLERGSIELGRRYWDEWRRIVGADRRALLEEGDGEDLLGDYRFWRGAEPEFTACLVRVLEADSGRWRSASRRLGRSKTRNRAGT